MCISALRSIAVSLMLALCAAPTISADAVDDRRTLTADDLYRVQDVTDLQVSPDGLWVAYVVTSNGHDSNEARSAI
jgi:hypothetical protein